MKQTRRRRPRPRAVVRPPQTVRQPARSAPATTQRRQPAPVLVFIPYLVLFLEVILFFRKVMFDQAFAIPWDLREFHNPLASFFADSLRRWELPLWDPFTYCGRPVYANLQMQTFYPPALIAVAFSNLFTRDLVLYFLEWEIVLHVFMSGVFTYWLLRRLNASTAAATLGATVYQLGGFFASQAQHLGAVTAAAWLPLVWLAILELRNRPQWRWIAVLAIGVAMPLLASMPQIPIVVIGSGLLLTSMLLAFRLMRLRSLWAVGVAYVAGFLLAAVQLLPALQLSRNSVAQYRTDWLKTGGGMRLEALMSLVLPNYYHNLDLKNYKLGVDITFLYVYCSIIGLLLCITVVLFRRNRFAWLFGSMSVLTAFWMLGDNTAPGRFVLSHVPSAIANAVYPQYALAAFAMSMAVLAGLGAHLVLQSPRWIWPAVLLVAMDLTWMGSSRPMNTTRVAAEPSSSRNQFQGSAEILAKARALVNSSYPPSRTDVIGASMRWATSSAVTKVPTASGYDPLALVRLTQVRGAFCRITRGFPYYQVSFPDSPVLDLVNVRYLIANRPMNEEMAKSRFRFAANVGREVAYENLEVLPRFFLVDRIRKSKDMEDGLRLIKSPDFVPSREAVVEDAAELSDSYGAPPGAVRTLEYSPRRVVLEVDTPRKAFLTTSEVNYPGWRARVDGEERRLYYTNVAFRGLEIPAGRHRVVMTFNPRILWLSALVSLIAAASLAYLVVRERRSFRLPRPEPQTLTV
jgi:hypothetical protein